MSSWIRHGSCTHKLAVVLVTCTRSSQQDQATPQQAALIGLNGVVNMGGGCVRGGKKELRVGMIKIHYKKE